MMQYRAPWFNMILLKSEFSNWLMSLSLQKLTITISVLHSQSQFLERIQIFYLLMEFSLHANWFGFQILPWVLSLSSRHGWCPEGFQAWLSALNLPVLSPLWVLLACTHCSKARWKKHYKTEIFWWFDP